MRASAIAPLIAVLLLVPGLAHAGGDWNEKGIAWRPYEQGLAEAKKAKKPICLVFFTEWCPHCTAYSKVFSDARVVEKAKQFIMIRVDNDKSPEVAQRHGPDGTYIPRTFFLSSAGVVDADIHAPREQFKFFFDENNPDSVLAAMDTAAKKLK